MSRRNEQSIRIKPDDARAIDKLQQEYEKLFGKVSKAQVISMLIRKEIQRKRRKKPRSYEEEIFTI